MLLKGEEEYYNRHIKLSDFGLVKQNVLKNSSVLVVGAGGLGCPVLQNLAGMGVGKIGIVDFDTIQVHNLHRQHLYTFADLGRKKVNVATQKIKQLNPYIVVYKFDTELSVENALDIISKFDYVVDCSDNFATRYLVNDFCIYLNKPFVHGSISNYTGQITVLNYKNGPSYRCLYPEAPNPEDSIDCNNNGVIALLPSIVGNLMAAQTCKVILNEIDVLSGKLLIFDFIKFSFNTIKFSKIEQNFNLKPLDSYEFMCTTNTKINSIELKKHLDNPEYEVIDVRDEIEFIQHNIGGKNIPLNNLINKIQEISFKPNVILICNTGKRSLLAQKKIQDLYKINTFIIALNEF